MMSQTSESSGSPLRCVLLQASGNIKILTVPFHCALRYGKRAIEIFLRTNELISLVQEFKFNLCGGGVCSSFLILIPASGSFGKIPGEYIFIFIVFQ